MGSVGFFSLTPGGMLGDFVSKVLVSPLFGTLLDGYKAKLAKDGSTDKVLADLATKEMLLDQRQRELDVQMNIADQGNWFTRTPRAIVQWSMALYIAKVVLWDIVLGLGSTISLKDPLIANAFNLIVAMWFGGRTLEKITSTVVNRIK
jgi:hypothetical protein